MGLIDFLFKKKKTVLPQTETTPEMGSNLITFEDVETAFTGIREGITLQLVKELEVSEEVVFDTFRHLMWMENKPAITMWEVNKTIEAMKQNQEVLELFSEGMRVKLHLMSERGMLIQSAKIRLHLLAAGIDIDKTGTKKMYSPKEFIYQAMAFYNKCKKTYSG
jgi:hypothetical protein